MLLLIFLIPENFSYMDNSDFFLHIIVQPIPRHISMSRISHVINSSCLKYMMLIKEGISAKHRQNYMAIISPSSYLRKLTGSFDNDDINVDMSKVV